MTDKDTPEFPWTPLEDRAECCVPVSLFEIRDLSLSYGGRTALKEVTFPIYRGCITSVMGPSGCGKTSFLTALNRLSDLTEGCEVTGEILLEGRSLRAPGTDLTRLRKRVGMIFQKPNPFPLSIRRNLELPLKEHGKTRRSEIDATIEECLKKVGLWDEVRDRLDSPALALSGGQQQRLCIARALCLEPEVLLMDEPCSALDPISSAVIENLIDELQGDYTIVVVTHNLAQARRLSSYAAFFWMSEGAGKLIEFGDAKQIFEAPKHELTSAYVQGLKG